MTLYAKTTLVPFVGSCEQKMRLILQASFLHSMHLSAQTLSV